MSDEKLRLLGRIADALERLSPAPLPLPAAGASAYVWNQDRQGLMPVARVATVKLELLVGVDQAKAALLENTLRFAKGLPANNALLWGARGMGKSSLVKAVHAHLHVQHAALALVEIHREDIAGLPALMRLLSAQTDRRFVLLCDDLSFEAADQSYKSLKAALEGGIEGRPANTVFYATSNRRHLLPRDMMDNERATAIHPGEAVEEKVSLSDRFGLWLGFHKCRQDEFLAMCAAYAAHFGLDTGGLRAAALEWSVTRGDRSGRVAWQFITDFAGRQGKALG